MLTYVALGSRSIRAQLDNCGAISRLVAMVCNGSSKERGRALTTLVAISGDKANIPALVRTGSIRELVGLIQTGTSSQRNNAASVLTNIAVVTQFEQLVADAGVIPLFVRMLESKSRECCCKGVVEFGCKSI